MKGHRRKQRGTRIWGGGLEGTQMKKTNVLKKMALFREAREAQVT